MNRLYYGDCLTILQEMPLKCVDLIYLDPPFNSDRSYNARDKDETGRPLPDQVEAFNDMWVLDEDRERSIRHMPVLVREAGIDDAVAEFWKIWMNALRNTQPNLLAYLSYMVERLIWMKGILKPTGSIYLHCDPTASHYIKIMMDGIFGHKNFKNEIIWHYQTSSGAPKHHFIKNTDIILFYSKGKNPTFNIVREPWPESTLKKWQRDENGIYRMNNGKKYYIHPDGKRIDNVWNITFSSRSSERLGYKTQKPVDLLERIIKASTNKGDTVLDPFCGCATTIEAAHNLGRKWIGIDIAIHAIKRVSKMRLQERLNLKEGVDFTIDGVPRNVEGAQDLWNRDKYHFQKWAVEEIDGFVTSRKSGDGGIDGRLYFEMQEEKDLQSMVVEVKGGKNVGINVIRDLRGVLERDTALMAGLIVLHEPGERKRRNFATEMAQAADLEAYGLHFPRMQMLTVQDIFDGKRFKLPGHPRGKSSKAQESILDNQ